MPAAILSPNVYFNIYQDQMQKLFLICFFFPFFHTTLAQGSIKSEQVSDSIRKDAVEKAALMFPRIRQFTITHEENGIGTIKSKMNGTGLFEGKYRSSRTKINMNIPVFQKKNNLLVSSIGVIHQFHELRDIKNVAPGYSIGAHNKYIPMLSGGITYMRTDSIFGRSITFTGSGLVLFNPSMSRNQFTFTGLATVPLIQTKNTRLSGGVVVLLDPASPIPFFLMFNYFHKFESWNLDLIADLPYRIALRKEAGKKVSFSLFNELGGSNSFFEFGNSERFLPSQKLTFSSLEVKSGLLAEYRLSKKAVVSMSGGMNYMVNSRIRENNSKPKDYFISNKHKPVPFIQIGFSLLPFWKGLNL